MQRLGVICLTLLFSIGAMGIGWAYWQDMVWAKYQVETGTISAGIRSAGVNHYGPENLDMGSTYCYDGPAKYALAQKNYSDSVDVTIYGYQSYAPVVTLEAANCGSVPVKLDQLAVEWSGDLGGYMELGAWQIEDPDGYLQRGHGYINLDRAIKDTDLEPGQTMWLDLEFIVSGEINQVNIFKTMGLALGDALKVKTALAAASGDDSPGDAASDDTESSADTGDHPSHSQQPADEASPDLLTLPEMTFPPGESSGGGETFSETGSSSEPELVWGTAYGTLTITYRPWNKTDW